MLRSALQFGGEETSVAAADWRKLIVSIVRKWRACLPGPYELLLPRSRTSLATWPMPSHNLIKREAGRASDVRCRIEKRVCFRFGFASH